MQEQERTVSGDGKVVFETILPSPLVVMFVKRVKDIESEKDALFYPDQLLKIIEKEIKTFENPEE